MIAGNGHVLGWEDVVEGRYYTTSVTCISQSSMVFKIKGEDLIKEFEKDERLVDTVLKVSKEKQKSSFRHIS